MQTHWLDDNVPLDTGALKAHGIVADTLDLDAFQPALDALRDTRGYKTQDIIALEPDTENLDTICAKFSPEHHHDDDEVRFVLAGEGIFDIRSNDDRWIRVTVSAGDLIVVPAGKRHRFFLTEQKHIRCVRLFKDPAGWTPVYREAT